MLNRQQSGDQSAFSPPASSVRVRPTPNIPTMFRLLEFVDAGGLIAYGATLDGTFASAALYVDRILTGAKAGDLPIEQPKYFELVVNMKSAKILDVTFSKSSPASRGSGQRMAPTVKLEDAGVVRCRCAVAS